MIEPLESRLFLHAGHDHGTNLELGWTDIKPTSPYMTATLVGPTNYLPLATVPALNSKPDATAQLYLDFDGAPSMAWGSYTSAITPAYDTDGNTASFSAGELTNIQQIFARVSEIYSPFNVNVTTVDPGNLTDKVTTSVIIGGSGSWYGTAGGVAYVGGFYNTAPNVAWVFPAMLGNGNPKYVSDAVAHESGHTFGLLHQSNYSGSTKTAEYFAGTNLKAPIMGNSYGSTRATWWNGKSSAGASSTQNDITILSNSANGFGYRTDDHGGTTGTASSVLVTGNTISAGGIIEQLTDKDYFSFSTLTGTVSFTASAVTYGNLDATLSLVTSTGAILASANSTALNETISANVSAGQYFLVVGSKALAGDLGQFNLTGTIVADPNFVATPANLAASSSNGGVSLRWTDMSWNETGFVIERSSDGGVSFTPIASNDAGDNNYADSSVTVGQSYSYRVKAIGNSDESGYSNTVTTNVTPATPSGLAATTASSTQISLTWNDTSGETGYRIDRSPNNSTWGTLATLAADETSYSSGSLANGTKYYYRVLALSNAGNSAPTAVVNATTTTVAPASITGTPSANSVVLAWTNVAGETGYRVERSLNGVDWGLLSTRAANSSTYTNIALSANTQYYYRVFAINEGGDSAASSELNVRTLLGSPSGVEASAVSSSRINLSWTDMNGETAYRIEQLSGTTWVRVGDDLDADETSLSVSGLSAGATYSFRMKALNSGGVSAASSAATATTIPAAPTTVTATALSTTQIRLVWSNVAGETGYKIEHSVDGSDWSQIATAAANATSYAHSSLATDSLHYYRVKPYNAAGDASASSNASTRTLLNAPSGLAAEVVSTSQVDLSWTDMSTETGYQVEKLNGTTWLKVGADLAADANELSITGLSAGSTNTYRVRAVNSGGTSVGSTAVVAITIPPAPILSATVLSDSQIKLTWTNVAGETSYKIERSPDGADWTEIAATGANVLLYTHTGLTPNTEYSYRVRAANAGGDGEYSSTAARTTLLPAPTGVSAEVVSTTRVDVSWTDSTGEIGYKVEKLNGTIWVQISPVLDPGTTTYSVTGLTAGSTNTFRVRVANIGGTSAGSATVTATTIPPAPTLTATVLADSHIKLTWTNVAGESGYKLERSPDGTNWTEVATTSANIVTYANTGLSANTAYSYRVRAANAAGNGAYSSTVSTTTFVAPPSGLAAQVTGTSQINLSWADSTGETGYRVEKLSGTAWVQVGATLSANVTSYSVAGLTAGTAYSYRLRAMNAGGLSLGSATVAVTTLPSAPTLGGTVLSSSSIKLTWSNVAGETGYKVERSLDGSNWTQIATTASNVVAYTNSSLSASTTYHYRVRAYNASGDGGYSIAVPKTTIA